MISDPLYHAFREKFGRAPSFLASAPGRVNLIGEHTDYNGFPVLPISIPHSIRAAAAPRLDRMIRVCNTDSAFPEHEFLIEEGIPPSPTGDWSNYIKAAAERLTERYGADLVGMDVMFEGNIPLSAGLSSSSALVVASAICLLFTNKIDYNAVELAEMMAEGERYVGTQGGGMDQAVCLLGRAGQAVIIDFFPLRYGYADFPREYSVVVAHSRIRAAKTENALVQYNRRPAECRLATAIINSVFKAEPPLQRLGDLPERLFFTRMDTIEDFVDRAFPHPSYSLEQVAAITGDDAAIVTRKYLMTRRGEPMPEPEDGFQIRRRALHALTEAERVRLAVQSLENGNAPEFGRLMNESHRSCDFNYDISTPELNALVSIMREAGAVGARLTGAGFGGCAIALVHDGLVAKTINEVRSRYFGEYISKTHPELSSEDTLFAIKPSDGATVRES